MKYFYKSWTFSKFKNLIISKLKNRLFGRTLNQLDVCQIRDFLLYISNFLFRIFWSECHGGWTPGLSTFYKRSRTPPPGKVPPQERFYFSKRSKTFFDLNLKYNICLFNRKMLTQNDKKFDFILHLKGTVVWKHNFKGPSHPPCKDESKSVRFWSFFQVSYKQEMRKSLLHRNHNLITTVKKKIKNI